MKKCEQCGKTFQDRGYLNHLKVHCTSMAPCPECGVLFREAGLKSHFWKIHGEGLNRPNGGRKIGCKAWNRGLTKSDPRVAKNTISLNINLRKRISEGVFKPYILTPRQRDQLSERMSAANPGGRCKWHLVSGVYVQGTWERDLALKMNDLGIAWSKRLGDGNKTWCYTDKEGKIRRYTPDFWIPEAQIQLEVKGYWWGNDRTKMDLVISQNSISICIVESELYRALLNSESKIEFLNLVASWE